MPTNPRQRVDELVREERAEGEHISQQVTKDEDAVTAGSVGGISVAALVIGALVGAGIGAAVLAATGLLWWAGLIIGGFVGLVVGGIVAGRLALNSVAPIAYERRNDRRAAGPPDPRRPRQPRVR